MSDDDNRLLFNAFVIQFRSLVDFFQPKEKIDNKLKNKQPMIECVKSFDSLIRSNQSILMC